MKKGLQRIALILGLFLFASCEEDGYVYPSVQLEFLTAETGSDGQIQSVVTDEGERLTIEKDHTRSQFTANSAVRIVANYELLREEGGQNEARIYTLLKPVSVDPQPAEKFLDGMVKSDPANVQSIWMGRDYLNMVLAVQAQNAKHTFGFAEETVKTGSDGCPEVTILLYHDAGGDVEAYIQRGYLSMPLKNRYPQGAHIRFKVNTSVGWQSYYFDYKPTEN